MNETVIYYISKAPRMCNTILQKIFTEHLLQAGQREKTEITTK
jgi:hypothetical protein